MNRKILITGCGRSGTQYMSLLLKAHGLDVGHEIEGTDGISSWYKAYEEDVFDYGIRIHIIRHPLKTISSCQSFVPGHVPEAWEYISRHLKINPKDHLIRKCMLYWYFWNLKAEEVCNYRIRIEDIDNVYFPLCQMLSINPDISKLKAIPKNSNTREGKFIQLKWKNLERADPILLKGIIKLMHRYGYNR